MDRKSEKETADSPLRKVVVIGPESTGKSSLCRLLSQHYQTLWCPEYAREYLLEHGMNYSYEDLLVIAQGQIKKEEQFSMEVLEKFDVHNASGFGQPLLIIDTDMYVMQVWCEFVFGSCHQWILEQIILRKYDLYLLCNVDLPWEKDELREYPDLLSREKLYNMYKELMINQTVPWVDISGNYDERLKRAIEAVDRLNKEQAGP